MPCSLQIPSMTAYLLDLNTLSFITTSSDVNTPKVCFAALLDLSTWYDSSDPATMASLGASTPPDDDRSRGYQLIAAHAVLLAISIISLLTRLFIRVFILAELGLDDLFIMFEVVSNLL